MNDHDWQQALAAIDVSAVDALKTLKQEQDVLADRLKQMEALKTDVADAVYLRVRADYEARNHAIEEQATPLKAASREQYAALRALLDRFAAAHEAVTLDRQEIELRHKLGEFDPPEFQRRIKDLETLLKQKAEAHERAQAIKAHFLEAFHSEDDLVMPIAAGRKAPPAPASGYRTQEQVSVDANTQDIPAPPPPMLPPSQTQIMPALDLPLPPRPASATAAPAAPTTAPAAIGSTVVIRAARLVPQNAEAGKNAVVLNLKALSIGADSANDVRIGGPGVEPRHAQVTVSMAGYTVVDLGSSHGTRVNAEKIRERLLRDQDVVQVGAARWVFREG